MLKRITNLFKPTQSINSHLAKQDALCSILDQQQAKVMATNNIVR